MSKSDESQDKLSILVNAYQIVEAELFAQFNGDYQSKRNKALFILTKLIIDEVIEEGEIYEIST